MPKSLAAAVLAKAGNKKGSLFGFKSFSQTERNKIKILLRSQQICAIRSVGNIGCQICAGLFCA